METHLVTALCLSVLRLHTTGGLTQTILAESNGHAYKEVSIPDLTSSQHVTGLEVANQRSSSPCTFGVSFGHGDTYIWVDKGCRADFHVTIEEVPDPSPSPLMSMSSSEDQSAEFTLSDVDSSHSVLSTQTLASTLPLGTWTSTPSLTTLPNTISHDTWTTTSLLGTLASTLMQDTIESTSLPGTLASTLTQDTIESTSMPGTLTSTLTQDTIESTSMPGTLASTLTQDTIESTSLLGTLPNTLTQDTIASTSLLETLASTLTHDTIASTSLSGTLTPTLTPLALASTYQLDMLSVADTEVDTSLSNILPKPTTTTDHFSLVDSSMFSGAYSLLVEDSMSVFGYDSSTEHNIFSSAFPTVTTPYMLENTSDAFMQSDNCASNYNMSYICTCRNTLFHRAVLEQKYTRITKTLKIKRLETSKFIRLKTSAKDERWSSASIGIGGLLIFVFLFVLIVLSDVTNIFHNGPDRSKIQSRRRPTF